MTSRNSQVHQSQIGAASPLLALIDNLFHKNCIGAKGSNLARAHFACLFKSHLVPEPGNWVSVNNCKPKFESTESTARKSLYKSQCSPTKPKAVLILCYSKETNKGHAGIGKAVYHIDESHRFRT